MLNIFKNSLFFVLFLFTSLTFANVANESVADVKITLIHHLIKDGYITDKNADEIINKYVKEEDKESITKSPNDIKEEAVVAQKESSWKDYLSLINFIKIIAIILVLVACAGLIKRLILACWLIIAAIPVIIYQTVLLAGSITGTFFPELIWLSQALYVAIFCSFINILLLVWIIASHEPLEKLISKLFDLGAPVECVASLYGLFYFTSLALYYQSSIFGFFAAMCLSASAYTICVNLPIFSKYNRNKELNSFIISHLIIVFSYALIQATGINNQWLDSFNIGLQYYCTIALCGALLINTSPFVTDRNWPIYLFLFIGLFILSVFGYFFWDLKIMSSIIMTSFSLFLLLWSAYVGFKGGIIVGTGTLGILLYGLSLLLEKYGSMIVASFY